MQISFLDLKAQYNSIKDEVTPAIQDVLDNTAYILGKSVNNFEKEFAKAHNAEHCIGVGSGTDGNHLALWSLGIKAGDEVIMPANTFIATAWGATLLGATPVFVDCSEDSYNIDPLKIEAAITPKTKAIVAVHLYGQSADMDPLIEISKKYKIHLVEDCAQAHLAEYKNKKVGGFGITSSFSFYPGKNLGAYGEAGAVLTNVEELAKSIRMLRDHGAVQKYNHEIYGHNYRMDGIQGAVLGVKMKHLESWTEGRRKAAELYSKYLAYTEGIKLPVEMDYAKHVHHLFVIQINNNKRDKLVRHLADNGISTGLHYPVPLHLQKCFQHLGYSKGDFPVSETLAENGLSLPMYPELNEEKIQYICGNIKEFMKQELASVETVQ